ncbi:MAG: energy transducer TonB [candidate division Zixibacteria bacterium]|nr:energy transducer TonB [candidate division Zixibacteria bacterium]
METRDYALYSPYGAYELKANYQRNLMLGMLLTTLLIAAAVLTSWLLADRSDTVVIPIDPGRITPPVEIVIEGGQKHVHVERSASAFEAGVAEYRPDVAGTRPVPVADDSIIYDDNATILNRAEWGLSSEIGDGNPGEGTGVGMSFGTDDIETFPEIDDYISVDQIPQLVYKAIPEYPRLARQAGIEGKTWVKALVDREGKVREVRLGKSSGNDSLDEAALEATRKCRFRPAIRANRPVAVWVTYPVVFRLDE